MDTQKCKVCEEIKPLSEYYSQKKQSQKRGDYIYYHKRCKQCEIKITTKRMYDNLDYWKEYWKERDKSEIRIQQKREHSERQRKSGYYKQWQSKNKEKVAEYNREREKIKLHKITNKQWDDCRKHFNNSCAYCGLSEKDHFEQYGEKLHKEHVNHNGSNGIENCVPSCKSCNSQKWQHNFFEWYSPDNENFSEERFWNIINWINKN